MFGVISLGLITFKQLPVQLFQTVGTAARGLKTRDDAKLHWVFRTMLSPGALRAATRVGTCKTDTTKPSGPF